MNLLAEFRWVDGHADVWRLFRSGPTLRAIVTVLAEPYRGVGITTVVGIESRGFLLGAPVAVELGVGFTAVRKAGALFPGELLTESAAPDYRGRRWQLSMQRDAVGPGDRALLVDDWIETGSQATAVRRLLARAGVDLAGIAVIVDQTTPATRADLPPLHALTRAEDLPA